MPDAAGAEDKVLAAGEAAAKAAGLERQIHITMMTIDMSMIRMIMMSDVYAIYNCTYGLRFLRERLAERSKELAAKEPGRLRAGRGWLVRARGSQQRFGPKTLKTSQND